jgi:hypothetical protein
MRFVHTSSYPVTPQIRFVRRFLWLPLTLLNPQTNARETRWLEHASLAEQQVLAYGGGRYYWQPFHWTEPLPREVCHGVYCPPKNRVPPPLPPQRTLTPDEREMTDEFVRNRLT